MTTSPSALCALFTNPSTAAMAGESDATSKTTKDQKVRVDDIARDDGLLKAKVKELTGEDVTVSPTNFEVHDLDSVDWNTACALLVQIDGGIVELDGGSLY
ncbi:hypothetical protein N7539_008739 [Penicillium diatomitis]|uniref:Uncharacterized protein n=1 Tax=Penicillium diatomitis TaxID=2819901 RepID=A0A9W9WQF2_9EURO|nr:uncharacterized protein N7539_008739 [Penicillium diatomitis]KAJ5471796.1 hypothetical protein N7539_008739 [Penicillium diatomitis]